MSSNLDSITGRINRGEGTAGKLVNDNELYNRLNSLSDRIDKVMAGLEQGDGTAGQLLRDRQLYENMNGTMVEMKSLVSDIRKDPKKYSERQGQSVLIRGSGFEPDSEESVMSQQGNGGGMFVAFIAGAIAGAAVALLFAPATGEETREYPRSARA